MIRDLGFADEKPPESRVPSPESLAAVIRDRGPLTVAAFMDLALYHPEFGYYARAAQRSGRAGDFFTSVDVGALFGQLLAIQIADCGLRIADSDRFDLVEAGAGNGRLSADILRALRERAPELYARTSLHLVEASPEARAAQPSVLADVADRLASSSAAVPESFDGVLIANELLDALPVHQVVMREDGLREILISQQPAVSSRSAEGSTDDRRLTTVQGSLSTPALQEYLDRLGIALEPGWRAEINLRAVDWIRDAARRLRRGFIILIDYGHEAHELYSASHSQGTLTTFARHTSEGPPGGEDRAPAWLQSPGEQDITAHVDFTSVRAAAEAEGLQTLAYLDQTYFVLGLLPSLPNPQSAIRNPQLKTLLMPGGLGSTHKVLILGKGVGTPALQCASFGGRVT